MQTRKVKLVSRYERLTYLGGNVNARLSVEENDWERFEPNRLNV